MTKEEKDFPTMTVNEINFKNVKDINSEMHKYGKILEGMEVVMSEVDTSVYTSRVRYKVVPKVVSERYRFCNYVIDPNKYRLRTVVRRLALMMRFIRNIRNSIRRRKKLMIDAEINKGSTNMKVPMGLNEPEDGDSVVLEDHEVICALNYYYRKSTKEVKHFRKKREYERISEEVDGVLYYKGRILLEQKMTGAKDMCDVMIDLSCRTFWVPLVDRYSPFAYSIVNEIHWHNKVAKHTGVEKTTRYTLQYAHILEVRELIKSIRKSCVKCRLIAKKQLEVAMGPVSQFNLNIAPAFYISQVDLMGPLDSYHGANKRATMKVWVIVFCCCTTGAVDLKLMEAYTTSSFILGFKRFGCRAGFPKMLLPDQGSQLVKACGDVKLNFKDIKGQLNTEYGVQFKPCPVGAHYMHGRVERKIRHIRESLSRSFKGQKLSTIGWETVCAEIANCINDLPIGVKSKCADVDNLDLLTPNRLLLGRNNERSPVGPVEVTGSPDRIISANNDIYHIWFKCWLTEYVPKLMQQQKWFKTSERELVVGDIVLFKSKDKEIETSYKYGVVKDLMPSGDGIARTVIVEYQNAEEKTRRTTKRGVRELILIQHIDEVGVMHELDEAANGQSD